jgi:hypothetical protein
MGDITRLFGGKAVQTVRLLESLINIKIRKVGEEKIMAV